MELMELIIGGKSFNDWNGKIKIQNASQVIVSVNEKTKELLLSIVLYSPSSKCNPPEAQKIHAELKDNEWISNKDGMFSRNINSNSISVFRDEQLLLNVTRQDSNKTIIIISDVQLYTCKGDILRIQNSSWKFDDNGEVNPERDKDGTLLID